MRHPAVLLFVLVFAFGCSKDDVEQDLEATELAYYTSAQESLRAGNYSGAIQKLQLLESRFPFGRYAEQAQLEIIYAYYQGGQEGAAAGHRLRGAAGPAAVVAVDAAARRA